MNSRYLPLLATIVIFILSYAACALQYPNLAFRTTPTPTRISSKASPSSITASSKTSRKSAIT